MKNPTPWIYGTAAVAAVVVVWKWGGAIASSKVGQAVSGWLAGIVSTPAPVVDEVEPMLGADGAPLPIPETIVPGVLLAGGIEATITTPLPGGKAKRALFSSTYPFEVELRNTTPQPQPVLLEIAHEYDALWGDSQFRDVVWTGDLAPGAVKRVRVQLDSRNTHQGLFEFGAADVFARVFVNGAQRAAVYYLME